MAYVLVALGALMAAAGLYTVGYSVLNARFDEYWTAVGAGVTLVAGGTITIGLGLAIRTLTQLKTALLAGTSAPPASDHAHPAAVAAETAPEPSRIEPEPAFEAPSLAAPPPAAPPPHPLRPVAPPAADPVVAAAPAAAVAAREVLDTPSSAEQPRQDRVAGPPHDPQPPLPVAAQTPPDANDDDLVFEAPRPADDYKLETPSTAEHDLPQREATRAHLVPPPPSPPAPELESMPDDWLDRAFAELDEELPVGRSPVHHSVSTTSSHEPPAPPEMPAMEPHAPQLEPAWAATTRETVGASADATAPYQPSLPSAAPDIAAPATRPTPPVIGRYEADGTSYVMYADGSIEAQSSSGVYRFASMAELKSFIES